MDGHIHNGWLEFIKFFLYLTIALALAHLYTASVKLRHPNSRFGQGMTFIFG
jgi:hypothetical protein